MDERQFPLVTENSFEFLKLSLAEQNILRKAISKKCLTLRFVSSTCYMLCAEIDEDCFNIYVFGKILENDLHLVLSQIPLSDNVRIYYNLEDNHDKLSRFTYNIMDFQERCFIYKNVDFLSQKFVTDINLDDEINFDSEDDVIGIIKNKQTEKIEYKILLTTNPANVTVTICHSNNKVISRQSINYMGNSYVETLPEARGKCFALLVTCFCYLEQYRLNRSIQYSVSVDNIESKRLRDFFLTKDDLIIKYSDTEIICEYLKTQPNSSILAQKDPTSLKEQLEQLILSSAHS
jgi:hypothetical protein